MEKIKCASFTLIKIIIFIKIFIEELSLSTNKTPSPLLFKKKTNIKT